MVRLYAVLSASAAVLLLFVFAAGFRASGSADASGRHALYGILVTVYVVFVHSLLMSHLLATGKGLKQAVKEAGLDAGFLRDLRRIKGMAFPPATFAPLFLVAAAILGAGVRAGSWPPIAHLVAMGVAVLANLLAFPRELAALRRDAEVLQRLDAALEAEAGGKEDARGASDGPDPGGTAR